MKCSFLLDQATEESAHETPQVSGLAARIAAFRASFADPVTVANHAAELESAKAENSRLVDENSSLKAENEKLKAELVAASAELDGIQHALSLKGDTSPVTALEQKISARVADTVASLGVDPAALPQAESLGDDVQERPGNKASLEKAMEGKSFQEQRALLLAFNKRASAQKANAKNN